MEYQSSQRFVKLSGLPEVLRRRDGAVRIIDLTTRSHSIEHPRHQPSVPSPMPPSATAHSTYHECQRHHQIPGVHYERAAPRTYRTVPTPVSDHECPRLHRSPPIAMAAPIYHERSRPEPTLPMYTDKHKAQPKISVSQPSTVLLQQQQYQQQQHLYEQKLQEEQRLQKQLKQLEQQHLQHQQEQAQRQQEKLDIERKLEDEIREMKGQILHLTSNVRQLASLLEAQKSPTPLEEDALADVSIDSREYLRRYKLA